VLFFVERLSSTVDA